MKKLLLQRVVAAVAATMAVLTFSALPTFAQANQTGNGFRISPVRSEFTINKGQSQVLNLTLENPSDAKVTARATINDFVASDKEDGEPRLILDDKAPAPKNSFKKLVKPIPDMTLAPKEKKDIPVTIQVPSDANSGGYYGAIRFSPVQNGQQNGNVGLTASVGTIVLVKVPGNLKERLDLVQLSAAKNGKVTSFFTNGNVSVITRLKNTGDIHLQPFGKIVVKDTFGKIVQETEFNTSDKPDSRANILPDSTRKFENNLAKRKWLGRYTVSANIGYTQGSGDLISATATFWYLPTWFIIALIAVILGVAALVFFLIRRVRKHK